jgi:hypothetical protein
VRLFWRFFMLKAASTHPPLIGRHYFQRRTPGHARYIAPVSPGRWERWREDSALVQADIHDRLALPIDGSTLDRTEWGKDPGLEPSFDPMLDRIQYLVENGLTSLMVLHDFLSKCLTPLQDRSHCPAWMYTGVNDIMRLDCRPGSSLGDTLLAVSLKALTTNQPSAELVTPGGEDSAVGDNAHAGRCRHCSSAEGRPVPQRDHLWARGSGRHHWWSRPRRRPDRRWVGM